VTNALIALFDDAEVGTAAMQVALKRWYAGLIFASDRLYYY